MTGAGADARGYLSDAYAEALAEFGRPRRLPRSGGWILEREVPGTALRDAMGPYPIFSCRDWRALEADLDEISDLVSLSLVADPFGAHDPELLGRCFPDRMVAFKEHFVTDLGAADLSTVSKHHRYYARRALAALDLDLLEGEAAAAFAPEWSRLYGVLAARHGLTGIKAFSPASFEKQLRVPGAVVLRARHEGATVGAHIWYLQEGVAFSHLAAVDERGYALMAAYGLYAFALEKLKGRAARLNLGAGAGAAGDAADGLTRFKRGWATGTVPVHFCGRIFDPAAYEAAARARPAPPASGYFPIYRAGELG
ncbi:MAG: hypothetical protein JOZ90_07600 [Alphaproteobacteria bacterium]|nr:hypothetical protein [Alphaproteobacteria bacterium]MBV9372933.1 hypothetical protein [Alphaproteobacteria bacterium]MBV9900948.1 hypothetical protein [Alphaproteobacteria bacterium]